MEAVTTVCGHIERTETGIICVSERPMSAGFAGFCAVFFFVASVAVPVMALIGGGVPVLPMLLMPPIAIGMGLFALAHYRMIYGKVVINPAGDMTVSATGETLARAVLEYSVQWDSFDGTNPFRSHWLTAYSRASGATYRLGKMSKRDAHRVLSWIPGTTTPY